jgi:phenylacetic acid degradation operon negative regulatory protein
MTQRADAIFHTARDALTRTGDTRVWSVIVTIFGDLAQDPRDQIPGNTLSELTRMIGIKPEAMRVALHRLRKDGWINSEKSGRTSSHRLTRKGFEESLAARPRIYATNSERPGQWHLLLREAQTGAARGKAQARKLPAGYLMLMDRVFLGQGRSSGDERGFVIDGGAGTVPSWVKDTVISEDCVRSYNLLYQDLQAVLAGLKEAPQLSELQVSVLRILIVHNWRRCILRHADLPDAFFPDGCPAVACRALVAQLLGRLGRPALVELK